jgi:hypothetical protein
MRRSSLVLAGILMVLPIELRAHPGNTASDGCHYCRTNCDKWGEAWGERHCHGGYDEPSASTYVQPKQYCPANSVLLGSTCYCNDGYAPLGRACYRIPANAHSVSSGRDAWQCDEGYVEKANACVPKPVPRIIKRSSSSSKASKSTPNQTVFPEQYVPQVPVDKYRIECEFDANGKCRCPKGYYPLSNYSSTSKLKGKRICSIL